MVTSTSAVARTVRETMERAGESVKHLAEVTLIPRSTLLRRLAGVSPFTIPELERIAAHFDTTVAEILADSEAAA